MKIKKTSKILTLILAAAIALVPAMVSAFTIDPSTGIGTITATEITEATTTVTFTVPYTITGATASDQITTLVTKCAENEDGSITYDDAAIPQPNNIVFIDQFAYDSTKTSFNFTVNVPTATAKYFVKVGGSGVTAPASGDKIITLTSTGFTVSGYVAVAGATVTLGADKTATTDADGYFAIPDVAPSIYDLSIAAKSAFTRTIPVTVTDASVEVSAITKKIDLYLGNIGQAEGEPVIIDSVDLMAIKAAFNKTTGVTGYQENLDFNSDGIIDSVDLMLVKANFNKTPSSYPAWVK